MDRDELLRVIRAAAWLDWTLADAVAADSTWRWPEHVPHLA